MKKLVNMTSPSVTRRSMLGIMAVAGMTTALVGCGSSSDGSSSTDSSSSGESESAIPGAYDAGGAELVISTWGFNSEENREYVFAPFEKAFNCTITTDEGNNGARLTKLQQTPDAYDVVQFSDYFMQSAIAGDLIAEVDQSVLADNLEHVYEQAKAPNGETYGPAFTFNRLGIIYDESAISDPITSWADLWRDDLVGQITIPDFSTTAGPWMLNIAADQLGVTLSEDNAEQCIQKLAEMKQNIVTFYSTSSDVVNMFNQGEVSVAVLQDFSSQAIQAASDDFVWVDPTEGTWGGTNVTGISKSSKNYDLAMAFVNYTIDKDMQQRDVNVGNAPTRDDVTLTDEQAKSMTYGKDVVDTIQMPDLQLLLDNRSNWQDLWNTELNTSAS